MLTVQRSFRIEQWLSDFFGCFLTKYFTLQQLRAPSHTGTFTCSISVTKIKVLPHKYLPLMHRIHSDVYYEVAGEILAESIVLISQSVNGSQPIVGKTLV